MSAFKVGDKVNYTNTKSNGIRLSFKLVHGTVSEVTRSGLIEVRLRNGRKVHVWPQRLTLDGQKTDIDRILDGLAGKTE